MDRHDSTSLRWLSGRYNQGLIQYPEPQQALIYLNIPVVRFVRDTKPVIQILHLAMYDSAVHVQDEGS